MARCRYYGVFGRQPDVHKNPVTMSGPKPLPTDDRRQLAAPHYSTRSRAQTPPVAGAFDAPLKGFCINHEWMEHIAGAVANLEWPDAWDGTPEEVQHALDEIVRIQEAMNCQCGGCSAAGNTTIIANMRLLLEIEFGDHDLDGVAPNRPNVYFDQDSSDVGDDKIIRENALCMAVQDYVHTTLNDAVAVAQGIGIGVVGVAVPIIFAVNPIAAVIFTGATSLLTAAFGLVANDAQIRSDVACCMLAGLQGKAVTHANFKLALDGCGFTPFSDLDIVREVVDRTTEDQVNFWAFIRALGSYFSFAYFDPLLCFCTEAGLFCDFSIDECAFDHHVGAQGNEAKYVADVGWIRSDVSTINHLINIEADFDEDIALTAVRTFIITSLEVDIRWDVWLFDDQMNQLYTDTITLEETHTNHKFEFSEVTGVRQLRVRVLKTGLQTAFVGQIWGCQVWADPAPFPSQ